MSNPAAPLVPIALLPPGIKDARQEALTRVLSDALSEFDIASLIMSDPLTVDAKLLPFMIREFSAQEFIEPGLKEAHVRALLSRSYELHTAKGYIAGVRLGLELLGVKTQWVQWFEEQPKAAPNTHRVTVIFDNPLFNGLPAGDLRHRRAVSRLIDDFRRESQHLALTFVIRARQQTHVGAHARLGGVVRTLALKSTNQIERSRITVGAFSRRGGVHHTKGLHAA